MRGGLHLYSKYEFIKSEYYRDYMNEVYSMRCENTSFLSQQDMAYVLFTIDVFVNQQEELELSRWEDDGGSV